jgi:hypothetical protein
MGQPFPRSPSHSQSLAGQPSALAIDLLASRSHPLPSRSASAPPRPHGPPWLRPRASAPHGPTSVRLPPHPPHTPSSRPLPFSHGTLRATAVPIASSPHPISPGARFSRAGSLLPFGTAATPLQAATPPAHYSSPATRGGRRRRGREIAGDIVDPGCPLVILPPPQGPCLASAHDPNVVPPPSTWI